MRRAPVRIRTFILGALVVLLAAPPLAGGGAWLIERDRQNAGVDKRVQAAGDYLTSHRSGLRKPAVLRGLERELDRLELLAQVIAVTASPPSKDELFSSPALSPATKGESARQLKARLSGQPVPRAGATTKTPWADRQLLLQAGTPKSPVTLVVDFYYAPPSRAVEALVGIVTGVLVLLAGLAGAFWLAGRWMVSPLAGLSAQVDRVAGGDLAIEVPRSRIGEIANIAQAIDGLTAALGESARRREEADEARRFLVTSVAHDLRTPLFALRGHLQAIRTRLGDPGLHLERAEARADALERLVGNLFVYTRDDYEQPAPRLEAVPVAGLAVEVTSAVEPATRLAGSSFELEGDTSLTVVVDRDRFKRALANVLDNALRYTPAGARIHVGWMPAGDARIELVVRDHGPGIDPGILRHVFEPGIHADTAADGTGGGAGLGLTIARRLLEHQNATITAGNPPGGGAEIRITLQRAP